MFDWHDRLQEPATGFWGVGQLSDARAGLEAMAGSMHCYHLWYATGRPLRYQDHAVDYALARPAEIDTACIDVDLVDLLVHASMLIDHRRGDTVDWLRRKLAALLAFQADDGGFPDELTGIRREDGWVRGYEEPQGISNTFSTWFRPKKTVIDFNSRWFSKFSADDFIRLTAKVKPSRCSSARTSTGASMTRSRLQCTSCCIRWRRDTTRLRSKPMWN